MGAYIPNNIFMDERTEYSADYGDPSEAGSLPIAPVAIVAMRPEWLYVPTQKSRVANHGAVPADPWRLPARRPVIPGQSTFMVEMMEANHAIQGNAPVLDFI